VPTASYDEHGALPPVDTLRPIPLTDIAQVKQWRSGAETGARRIGIAGAFIGACLGLAVGGYAAEYDDEADDSNVEYYVVGAMMGATIVGMAGLVTGAGVGAMVHGWYPLQPGRIEPPAPAPEVVVEDPTFSRLLVEAGWSTSAGDAFETSGLGVAVGLLGRPAPTLEMGPVLRYHALDGRVDEPPAAGGATFTMIQPVGTISLDLRCQSASAGWRPWIDGGLGWSLANDVYPSAHLGVGLRLRVDPAHDYGVSVRRHMALRSLDDGIENYWTVGATFGFTL
jgi:hypothetical protein